MKYAIKNSRKTVKAYQLGHGSAMEEQLIQEGRIKVRSDGSYELFSQEAVNGSGEIAYKNDYFKVDFVEGKYYPYPNKREWFEENHIHLQGDEYVQRNKPLAIWQMGDEECEEMEYLLKTGKLIIKEEDELRYFNAFLWGSDLSAGKDATIVFYSVDRDQEGAIQDISFNFVAAKEFEKNYMLCQ